MADMDGVVLFRDGRVWRGEATFRADQIGPMFVWARTTVANNQFELFNSTTSSAFTRMLGFEVVEGDGRR